MMTEEAIHSDLAIPPGEYLEEVICELGMTKDELARRMGRPATKLSPLFKGEKTITSDTALQLEKVVGVPAHIWTGLEAEYRLTLARQEEKSKEAQMKNEAVLVSKFPYSDLVKAGEIEKKTRPIDKIKALQKFFGVTSLRCVTNIQRYQAAFRCGKAKNAERTFESVSAWLRMGERRANSIHCKPFNKGRLQDVLGDLRRLTLLAPEMFDEQLHSIFEDCGVALVICPHFAKTKAHGATFWLGRDKAVLMITIRGKWADIFWFSLFHEIGHLLLHGRQAVILEDNGGDQREKEADSFAAKTLIPPDAYKRFKKRNTFYPEEINAFAQEIGIHTGIIVGCLQHERLLKWNWGNELRVRYDWVKQN